MLLRELTKGYTKEKCYVGHATAFGVKVGRSRTKKRQTLLRLPFSYR